MALQSVRTIVSHPKFGRYFNGIGLLLAAVLIGFSSNYMLSNEFWGYSPIPLLIGIWLLFNSLYGLVFPKKSNFKYWLLSSASGVLLYLGFPDPSMTPLLFLALLPIFEMIEQAVKKKSSAWQVWRYCYSGLFLWNILSTFWVTNVSFIPSFFAFGLNSLFMSIPFILYFKCRQSFTLRTSMMAFVAFYLGFEMLHLRWEISWPWLTLGNAFSTRSLWIQWYEYTGHLGGSFWVLATNAILFNTIQSVRKVKQLKPVQLLYPMLCIMGPIILSFFVYMNYQDKGESVNMLLIQPNYEPHYEKFSVPQYQQTKRFNSLIEQNMHDSIDYVVLPETALGPMDRDHIKANPDIQSIMERLSAFPNTSLISGLVTIKRYLEKPEGVDNIRTYERANGTTYLQVRNSAVEIRRADDDVQEHIKGKLVPGAEIFPFSKILFFLEPIVRKAGGTIAGHARSKTPTIFTKGKAKLGVSICYESIYGYWMRKYVQNGANLLTVVTNDGWWDNTPGHRQHLAYSVLRAIELRRSIGRSANTGISCVIDQHGRVFKPLAYGTQGAIVHKLQINDEITFYAKHGDLIGRLAVLLTGIFLAFMFLSRFKK